MINIALAGNPNSGKTSLFNELTGARQHVGNWPGVTVEKKDGRLKGHNDVMVTDLPGIYSLSPYTLEEVVSRDYIMNEHPDVIVNIVDATNLERNLYLTTQLLEMNTPMVIALNMMDLVEKRGIKDKFDIASAATSTEEIWNGKGNSIYPPAQAELKKHGIGKTAYTNFSSKRARQVTKQDYNYYDYLLCADSSNIRNTIRITGTDTDNKIKLLLDYTDRKGSSIADPWYSGNFVDTYRDVVEGCEGFLAYLESQHVI